MSDQPSVEVSEDAVEDAARAIAEAGDSVLPWGQMPETYSPRIQKQKEALAARTREHCRLFARAAYPAIAAKAVEEKDAEIARCHSTWPGNRFTRCTLRAGHDGEHQSVRLEWMNGGQLRPALQSCERELCCPRSPSLLVPSHCEGIGQRIQEIAERVRPKLEPLESEEADPDVVFPSKTGRRCRRYRRGEGRGGIHLDDPPA